MVPFLILLFPSLVLFVAKLCVSACVCVCVCVCVVYVCVVCMCVTRLSQ